MLRHQGALWENVIVKKRISYIHLNQFSSLILIF